MSFIHVDVARFLLTMGEHVGAILHLQRDENRTLQY